MITCHQCGSEVAENDAFCPYCGISLQPVAVPAEEDEFASTIIMPPVQSAPAEPSQAAEDGPIVDAVEVPEPEPAKEQAQVEPEKEPDPVSHFPTGQPDYNDIPTPPALAELERADSERKDLSGQQPVEHQANDLTEPDDYPTIASATIESPVE